MKSNKREKFGYYFLGINVLILGFVADKSYDLEQLTYNLIPLLISVPFHLLSIFCLLSWIIADIYLEEEKGNTLQATTIKELSKKKIEISHLQKKG